MLRFFLCFFYPFVLFAKTIPITIETADTDEKRIWGLMGRDRLPKNHGMLFIYDKQRYLSVWMFNTRIDLSAAFIDNKGIITEIRQLQAYPEIMDPDRPVLSLNDLRLYPPQDPIVLFFRKKRATSLHQVRYVLEMQMGWFKKHGIRPGDRLQWNPGENKATIQLQKRTKRDILSPKGE
ncbi:putative uncharacterized protein [Waddlia chondrophila 2032/99]|uniref:DUF192 domain-containing protein n=2 Tax=Waddlia chondrophila TaxID=71667 RepID=D6YWZ7_WADCW|nr:DUF192 domain-containing protein [Waddlia chondrophila]ADI38658.1 conserved hypothetical protein [Waddlia chondrophila WSU 86-1044]CCB90891.1 putative uncharacterized protein [Waddlia chondrophila 2032/99]